MRLKKAGGVGWTFLSNHAHVFLCIARHPEMLLREVAERVGITERAVQRIVAELEEGQYLERTRSGRRNRYEVHPELPLRHPIESQHEVGALLALVQDKKEKKAESAEPVCGGNDGPTGKARPGRKKKESPA